MASVLLAITTEAVLHSEYPAGPVIGVVSGVGVVVCGIEAVVSVVCAIGPVVGVIDAVVGTVADVIEADAKAVVGGRRQGCRCGCYQGHRQGSR